MFNPGINLKESELNTVMRDGLYLEKVVDQTEEICKAAIEQNGLAFSFVKDKTPELCMFAVQHYGPALEYIKDQTEELCLEAVKQDYFALLYAKYKTPEICTAAVRQNGNALRFMDDEQTEELCLEAVKNNGMALEHVKVQSEEICLNAVLNDPRALRFVTEEYKGACDAAIWLYNEKVNAIVTELRQSVINEIGSAKEISHFTAKECEYNPLVLGKYLKGSEYTKDNEKTRAVNLERSAAEMEL